MKRCHINMRNHLKLLTVLLTALLLFVGCGTDDGSESTGTPEEDNIEQAGPAENNTTETNDDTEVAEDEEDYRIVATTVALVEIMDALDLDLVGVPTSYKDLPARYDDAVEVGMAAEPDMEIIKSLKPDDVLSATTLDAEFDLTPVFESADVPVTFVDMEGIDNMYESIAEIAKMYDREELAEEIVAEFATKAAEID